MRPSRGSGGRIRGAASCVGVATLRQHLEDARQGASEVKEATPEKGVVSARVVLTFQRHPDKVLLCSIFHVYCISSVGLSFAAATKRGYICCANKISLNYVTCI